MVLPGRLGGRVGRRPLFIAKPRPGNRSGLSCLWSAEVLRNAHQVGVPPDLRTTEHGGIAGSRPRACHGRWSDGLRNRDTPSPYKQARPSRDSRLVAAPRAAPTTARSPSSSAPLWPATRQRRTGAFIMGRSPASRQSGGIESMRDVAMGYTHRPPREGPGTAAATLHRRRFPFLPGSRCPACRRRSPVCSHVSAPGP